MRDDTQQTEKRGPRRLAKKKRRWPGILLFLALAAALAAGAAGLYRFLNPEPVTFTYRDRVLEAKAGVPVNRYVREGFTVDENGRVSYFHNGLQAREGIDVSFYQGEIGWEAVAADGVDFAMIRLGYRGYTEGGLRMDSRFEENIQGALDAGLEVGVYFFSQAVSVEEAEEEARFVLNLLEDYDITGPVVFDWENISNDTARTDNVDSATLTAMANAFCSLVEEAGYHPMIYCNQYIAYLLYDLEGVAQYPLWIAQYSDAPDFYYAFQMWQYTDAGQVAGIQGKADLTLCLEPW